MQATRSCVAATVLLDFEGASGTNRTVPRGNGDFPVAPFLVVDMSGGHSFHCPTLSDDLGRDTREEIVRSTGDMEASPRGNLGIQAGGRKERPPQQETTTDVDTSYCRTGVGTIQATANGRLANASFRLPAQSNREHFERMRIWIG